MNSLKITTGDVEVIASGIVIAFPKSPIIFDLTDLKLIFEFHDETPGEGPREARIDGTSDGNTLKLTLHNFSNPLGVGSTQPIQVGVFRGRRLLLNYRVYSLGKADKTLQYTLYLAEEVPGHGQ